MKKLILCMTLILVFRQLSAQWNYVGTAGITTNSVVYHSFAIDNGGTPYIAYQDGGNYLAAVMKFNGTSWVSVGGAASTNWAQKVSLAIDNTGVPYIAYIDIQNTSKISVTKFNGSTWVPVGTLGFSPGTSDSPMIAIDASGTPYVVFVDNNGKAMVMKFNGSNWVQVGGIASSNTILEPDIKLDGGGVPFVSYADGSKGNRATLMKFNGTSWDSVGVKGFSPAQAEKPRLVLAGSTPYLAFVDHNATRKASVMKYNGSWSYVGSAGFTTSDSLMSVSLAINGSGTPFVAFGDADLGNKLSVMSYTGGNWAYFGTSTFSSGAALEPMIALNGSGTPYVSFRDIANSNKISVMKFASTAGVNELITEKQIGFYPNPGTGIYYISNSQLLRILSVYDAIGNSLDFGIEKSGDGFILDITKYSNGIYFVRLEGEKGMREILKIIKE